MGTTYEKCPKEVHEFVGGILHDYYPELAEVGAKVSCVFSFAPRDKNGNPTGPGVKLHGYPCAAVIRKTTLKQRVMGAADAEITIDGDEWPNWSEKRRQALIDHELYHLELAIGEDGRPTFDDIQRPKFKVKLHDWQLGGFAAIVQRHGDFAFEQTAAQDLIDKHGQHLFPWLKPRKLAEVELHQYPTALKAAATA